MRRLQLLLLAPFAFAATVAAQTPPTPLPEKKADVFNHLDLALTTGSTGIGLELATPLGSSFRLRAGFSFMPHFNKVLHFGVKVGDQKEGQSYEAFNSESQRRFNTLKGLLEGFTGYSVDNQVDMNTQPTYYNGNLLVDFFPLPRNKHWHITAGVYLGNKQIGRSANTTADMASLLAVGIYNNMYKHALTDGAIGFNDKFAISLPDEVIQKFSDWGSMSIYLGEYSRDVLYDEDLVVYYPADDWYEENGEWAWHEQSEVMYTIKKGDPEHPQHRKGDPYRMVPDDDSMAKAWAYVNKLKPYVGFGFDGRMLKNDDRWQIGFDAGVMFWGGAPDVVTHDGTSLTKDVENVRGRVGDYVDIVKKFKAFPVLNLRITRRLF